MIGDLNFLQMDDDLVHLFIVCWSLLFDHGAIIVQRLCFRVVHGSDGPAGRVGTSGHDFARFWQVDRVSTSDIYISWYLNRYESPKTIFGLIDFLRYLIYNN